MLTAQARQSIQLRFDGGQCIAQCKRKESLCGAVYSIVRTDLAPAAQQAIFVTLLGAETTKTLQEVGDTHRRERKRRQRELNNCAVLAYFT